MSHSGTLPHESWKLHGKCVASFIYGIISIVLFWMPTVSIVLSIVAIASALKVMRGIRNSSNEIKGRGMARAGLVCGIAALLLIALRALYWASQSLDG